MDQERVMQAYRGLQRPNPWPEDIRVAVEVMEREMAKEPFWDGKRAWRCPACTHRVRSSSHHRDVYCVSCGQRLWPTNPQKGWTRELTETNLEG
jgi:tRNA(Ile2) C34 agmatinyltransferase TiaS